MQPTLVIQPTRGWSSLALREIWQYRELLWIFVARNVKGRYRQMALGPLWIVLKPLVDMVVFTVIFGKLAKLSSEGLPYPIFTFAAIVPWTFFANATSNSVSSLINNMHIISKVYFPRLVVPISAVIGGLVDMAVAFVVLMGMMIYYKVALSTAVLALPLYVLLAIATALGVGLWCATIAVKFRDLQYAIDYGLQVLKFATPVAYTASLIPSEWQTLYRLNPMFWVVEGFRWALLGKGQPPQTLMLVSVALVLLLLLSGAFIFRRTERTIVDLL
ncbi:MAG: ABC transporter permease [Abditibacteriales bacterium]|nr:ABC transporter permease [Abditibacteriales bacterium]MDW8367290.1 ABC transporter permease [Abditibacteriales bacterium]